MIDLDALFQHRKVSFVDQGDNSFTVHAKNQRIAYA